MTKNKHTFRIKECSNAEYTAQADVYCYRYARTLSNMLYIVNYTD